MNTQSHRPDEYGLNPLVTPAMQLRTLTALFTRITEVAGQGETPVVELDLDLCALLPVYRTRAALIDVGREFGIDLFRHPDLLPLLPGYTDEAWAAFVAAHRLADQYPNLEWHQHNDAATPFGRFHQLYWQTDRMAEDRPSPGLGGFVQRVGDAGGRVVFISGRWLKEHVDLTYACLRRAGIADPLLIIGNARHESLVADPTQVVSDSQAKAAQQAIVRTRYGRPVAVADDRARNREAMIAAISDASVLNIAVAAAGFTCDVSSAGLSLVLSSFESFDTVVGHAPRRRRMLERYAGLGYSKRWRGLYEGLGRNKLQYVLPRLDGLAFTGPPPFAALLADHAPGSLDEATLVERCMTTISTHQIMAFDETIDAARRLSDAGIAAPFPADLTARLDLRRCLITSWLHSRDIEHVMAALGYSIPATGVHDMVEYAKAGDVIHLVRDRTDAGRPYSRWLTQWAETLDPAVDVNIGCMNPHLLVGMWQWTPADGVAQDAMDVHRLSDHHEGDGNENYDPLEAAVNNLLHLREGPSGIRKEPVTDWEALEGVMMSESGLERLGKSSVGRDVLRDAIVSARRLERDGWLTPWGLTAGSTL